MTTDRMPVWRTQKFANLTLSGVTGEGWFSGYASIFGEVDLGKDAIAPGAFQQSLTRRGASGVRMLFQHDPGEPLGTWKTIREDARGLYVEGLLSPGVARAQEVHMLMKAGALDGLSIGFQTVKAKTDGKTGVRRILEADLWEISIVTFPMLPSARVSNVKNARFFRDTETELVRTMRRAARMMKLSDRISMNETCNVAADIKVAPEIKTAPETMTAAFEDFMGAFEAFKETNDRRLGELESKLTADVVTRDKMDRISRTMDEQKRVIDQLALKKVRPALGRSGEASLETMEHKAAFESYIRRGDEQALRELEAKAFSIGSASDGGYLVPNETDTDIGRRLSVVSPIRAMATVRQVSGAVLKKPFALSGMATGWVAETAARPQTTTPQLAELSFPTMELYAMPAATAALLDDAAVDIENWIASEVDIAFGEQEGTAFVSGDGINKPKGFLSYTNVAEASWSWGNIGYVATGVAGAFKASGPSDTLIDTIYALKAGHRQNAAFVMNRKSQAEIRKFKDADGNYLWRPPAVAGQQASLIGFPIAEAEDMPDIGAGSTSIAFGNFAAGYLVVDRTGVRVLRDPYSAKPYVLFYTTKRVGGGVQNFEAIKLIKFAAS